MTTKSKKQLVVVDADTLVYRSAAASEQRSVLVKHLPSNREKIYKTRTEFKKAMQEKNFEVNQDDFTFKDIQEPEPIANCLHTIKMQAQNIIDRFSDAEVIFCCGEKDNFRLNLELPEQYKSNRVDTIRPVHLSEGKEFLIKKFNAQSAVNMEVDDLSIIIAYEGKHKGRDVVLASPDKDSRQAVGLKLFDYLNSNREIIEIKDWHEVELSDKKEFKSYGVPWLCWQWIAGDISDFYSAKSLSKKRFGDVAAYKEFSKLKTKQEVLIFTLNWFRDSFGKDFTYTSWTGNKISCDWKFIANLYFQCAKMKYSFDDKHLIEEYLNLHGVNYDW